MKLKISNILEKFNTYIIFMSLLILMIPQLLEPY